jgi:hypothetical protein
MKRLLAASLSFVVLCAAPAGAKQLVGLTVCGTNGCHSTHDRHELAAAMQTVDQADPGRAAPFFKLRQAIGEPGSPELIGRVESLWMPATGVTRSDDQTMAYFTMFRPRTQRVLRRLAHGLRAFPAAKLPPEPGSQHNARVTEVVPAPATRATDGSSSGGGGLAWAWALLAIPPAGLVLAMRRRGRWI